MTTHKPDSRLSEQFSLPGFDAAPPRRQPMAAEWDERQRQHSLFFAVYPGAEDAAAIRRLGARLKREHGLNGNLLGSHRLHVSLLGLGRHSEIPQEIVEAAKRAAAALACPAFDVVFDRALSFPASGAFVLIREERTSQLIPFQEELGMTMREAGFRVSAAKFEPHITLMYDSQTIPEHAVEPIQWRATGFSLIDSHAGTHEVLGHWTLLP